MTIQGGPAVPGLDEVLTPAALEFLSSLHRRFEGRRQELVQLRRERQVRFDAGETPDFLAETAAVREDAWTIGPIPPDLLDRRV